MDLKSTFSIGVNDFSKNSELAILFYYSVSVVYHYTILNFAIHIFVIYVMLY